MIFKGKYGARSKIVINEEIMDHISNINYLGCEILLLTAHADIKLKS
jgi:hypothetical protein